MTRRIVVWTDESSGVTYKTPEFNGDRNEFLQFHGESASDSCSTDWDEIFREFEDVRTLKDFVAANIRAQKYYSSFLGEDILPVEVYSCAGKNIVTLSRGKAIDLISGRGNEDL